MFVGIVIVTKIYSSKSSCVLTSQNQDVEMWALPAEGNALWIATVLTGKENGSGLQIKTGSEWTNWKITRENNFGRKSVCNLLYYAKNT